VISRRLSYSNPVKSPAGDNNIVSSFYLSHTHEASDTARFVEIHQSQRVTSSWLNKHAGCTTLICLRIEYERSHSR